MAASGPPPCRRRAIRGCGLRRNGSRLDSSNYRPKIEASDDFHVAVELPLGDGLAELTLFPFAGCRIVIDEGVAEQLARRRRRLETSGGLHQGTRQLRLVRMLDLVGVALDGLAGIDLVLDAPQARADGRGQRQVGVRIGG